MPNIPDQPFLFLGGTCGSSQWRDQFIPLIPKWNYFNPLVSNWTPADQVQEEKAKEAAALEIYVITPKQTGFYSFVEMTYAALKERTDVFIAFIEEPNTKFTDAQKASNTAIAKLLDGKGRAHFFDSLEHMAQVLNKRKS